MKIHELKTDPEVFEAVWTGKKKFEIRKDDRGFQIGDGLDLRETRYTGIEMSKDDVRGTGKPLEYTGRSMFMRITHILRGPIYGLQDGWVIMSITDGSDGS